MLVRNSVTAVAVSCRGIDIKTNTIVKGCVYASNHNFGWELA